MGARDALHGAVSPPAGSGRGGTDGSRSGLRALHGGVRYARREPGAESSRVRSEHRIPGRDPVVRGLVPRPASPRHSLLTIPGSGSRSQPSRTGSAPRARSVPRTPESHDRHSVARSHLKGHIRGSAPRVGTLSWTWHHIVRNRMFPQTRIGFPRSASALGHQGNDPCTMRGFRGVDSPGVICGKTLSNMMLRRRSGHFRPVTEGHGVRLVAGASAILRGRPIKT